MMLKSCNDLLLLQTGTGIKKALEHALEGGEVFLSLTGPGAPSLAFEQRGQWQRVGLDRDKVSVVQGLIEKFHALHADIAAADVLVAKELVDMNELATTISLSRDGIVLSGNHHKRSGYYLVFKAGEREVRVADKNFKFTHKDDKTIVAMPQSTFGEITQALGDLTNTKVTLSWVLIEE